MMLLLSVFSLHYLRLPVVVVAPICVSFFSCFLLEYLLAAESWRCKITSDELSAYSSAVASGASSAAEAGSDGAGDSPASGRLKRRLSVRLKPPTMTMPPAVALPLSSPPPPHSHPRRRCEAKRMRQRPQVEHRPPPSWPRSWRRFRASWRLRDGSWQHELPASGEARRARAPRSRPCDGAS